MKQFRVAISIGHWPLNSGYSVDDISEYSEMSAVAGLLIRELQILGHDAFLIESHLLDVKVSQINELQCNCCVELHLNAGGGHGYETLFCPNSIEGLKLANSVNKMMGSFLETRNRGVKEGWYKMKIGQDIDFLLQNTNCPAIITEAYFLDNMQEREKYVGNVHFFYSLAKSIAIGITLYLNGVK